MLLKEVVAEAENRVKQLLLEEGRSRALAASRTASSRPAATSIRPDELGDRGGLEGFAGHRRTRSGHVREPRRATRQGSRRSNRDRVIAFTRRLRCLLAVQPRALRIDLAQGRRSVPASVDSAKLVDPALLAAKLGDKRDQFAEVEWAVTRRLLQFRDGDRARTTPKCEPHIICHYLLKRARRRSSRAGTRPETRTRRYACYCEDRGDASTPGSHWSRPSQRCSAKVCSPRDSRTPISHVELRERPSDRLQGRDTCIVDNGIASSIDWRREKPSARDRRDGRRRPRHDLRARHVFATCSRMPPALSCSPEPAFVLDRRPIHAVDCRSIRSGADAALVRPCRGRYELSHSASRRRSHSPRLTPVLRGRARDDRHLA